MILSNHNWRMVGRMLVKIPIQLAIHINRWLLLRRWLLLLTKIIITLSVHPTTVCMVCHGMWWWLIFIATARRTTGSAASSILRDRWELTVLIAAIVITAGTIWEKSLLLLRSCSVASICTIATTSINGMWSWGMRIRRTATCRHIRHGAWLR